jgi:hypothetical protein
LLVVVSTVAIPIAHPTAEEGETSSGTKTRTDNHGVRLFVLPLTDSSLSHTKTQTHPHPLLTRQQQHHLAKSSLLLLFPA